MSYFRAVFTSWKNYQQKQLSDGNMRSTNMSTMFQNNNQFISISINLWLTGTMGKHWQTFSKKASYGSMLPRGVLFQSSGWYQDPFDSNSVHEKNENELWKRYENALSSETLWYIQWLQKNHDISKYTCMEIENHTKRFQNIVAILLTEWRRAYQPAADYASARNK